MRANPDTPNPGETKARTAPPSLRGLNNGAPFIYAGPPALLGMVRRAKKVGTVPELPGSKLLNFSAWKGALQPLNPGRIPEELKELRQWLGWRDEQDESGKPTKHPNILHAPGRMARSNDPKTWNTFDLALSVAKRFSGLGFVLTAADPWTCVDLDHILNKVTGIIEPWAWEITKRLNSYTEISPSGEGVHIWVRGKVVDTKRKRGNVEIFFAGFYLTMTGYHLQATPTTIEDRQTELEAFFAEAFTEPPASIPSLIPASDSGNGGGAAEVIHDADLLPPETEIPAGLLSDAEIIKIASRAANGSKFQRLFRGEWQGDYPSQSEADFALVSILIFYTQDFDQVVRIFCMSGLYRLKWDRKDYQTRTIDKALSQAKEFYKGKAPVTSAKADKITTKDDLTSVHGLSELLKIPIQSIVRISGEPVKTVFKIQGGGEASFTTKELLQQRTFRARILDACEQLPAKFVSDEWEKVVEGIVKSAEKQDCGDEATPQGILRGNLIDFLRDNPSEAPLDRGGWSPGCPLLSGGEIFILSKDFLRYLNTMGWVKMDPASLAQGLRSVGATPTHRKKIGGVDYKFWRLPPELQPEGLKTEFDKLYQQVICF
jgi:putative DNA primase/helicase